MILEFFKKNKKQIVGFLKLSILAVNSRAKAAKFEKKVREKREKYERFKIEGTSGVVCVDRCLAFYTAHGGFSQFCRLKIVRKFKVESFKREILKVLIVVVEGTSAVDIRLLYNYITVVLL